MQWRATLSTRHPLETPVLKSVQVAAEVETQDLSWGRVLSSSVPEILRSSHAFGYQAPSRRTKMLRSRWHLDELVAGAEDDFEIIVRLAHWVREQWTDGWNRSWKALHYCPPWDAPLILELGRFDLAPTHDCPSYCPFRQICHYSPVRAELKGTGGEDDEEEGSR